VCAISPGKAARPLSRISGSSRCGRCSAAIGSAAADDCRRDFGPILPVSPYASTPSCDFTANWSRRISRIRDHRHGAARAAEFLAGAAKAMHAQWRIRGAHFGWLAKGELGDRLTWPRRTVSSANAPFRRASGSIIFDDSGEAPLPELDEKPHRLQALKIFACSVRDRTEDPARLWQTELVSTSKSYSQNRPVDQCSPPDFFDPGARMRRSARSRVQWPVR
jgi:hypothetical protein